MEAISKTQHKYQPPSQLEAVMSSAEMKLPFFDQPSSQTCPQNFTTIKPSYFAVMCMPKNILFFTYVYTPNCACVLFLFFDF